jgi:RNA polymerase sigma factor (sigma-70 family)
VVNAGLTSFTSYDLELVFANLRTARAPEVDKSFAELYQLQMPWLVSFCRSLTWNTSVDGEDIAAITIETAWRHRFDISHHPGAFRNWLRTTARHEAARQIRQYIFQILCDDDELLAMAGGSSEDVEGGVQVSEWCRAMLAQLPKPMRSVLVLRSYGYRDKEIAEMLKIPEARVRVIALRAREKAMKALKAEQLEDSAA